MNLRTRAILAVVLAAMSAPAAPACAQDLNLDPSQGPTSRDARHAQMTIASLRRDAERLDRPEANDQDLARAAMMRHAALLIERGESLGTRGSAHVVAGRKLARAAADPGEASPPSLVNAWDAGAIPPDEPGLRAFLAQAFAFAADPSTDPWWTPPRAAITPSAAPMLPTVVAAGLDQPAADAAAILDARRNDPALASDAGAMLGVLDGLVSMCADPPGWLRGDPIDRFRAGVAAALADAATTPPPEGAEPRLAVLSSVAACVRSLSAEPNARAARPIRESLAEALARLPERPTRADAQRWAQRADRLAAAAVRRLDRESHLPATRPMIAALESAHRQSRTALLDALTRALGSPEAESDPAVLSALSAHARRSADLDIPGRLSVALRRLAGAEPGSARVALPKPWSFLHPMILRLSQDTLRAETRDLALDQLRTLADTLDAASLLPFEDRLRAASPADPLVAAIGPLRGDLLAWVDTGREEWRTSMESAFRERREPPAGGLADLVSTWNTIVRVRSALAPAAPAALNAWAGWECSPEAWEAVVGTLRPHDTRLAAALRSRNPRALANSAASIADDDAPALLGRLALSAHARPATSPLAQLASRLPPLYAPAPPFWMIDRREDLAYLCRYAEEFAAARAVGDRDAADRLGRLLNERAARVHAAAGSP